MPIAEVRVEDLEIDCTPTFGSDFKPLYNTNKEYEDQDSWDIEEMRTELSEVGLDLRTEILQFERDGKVLDWKSYDAVIVGDYSLMRHRDYYSTSSAGLIPLSVVKEAWRLDQQAISPIHSLGKPVNEAWLNHFATRIADDGRIVKCLDTYKPIEGMEPIKLDLSHYQNVPKDAFNHYPLDKRYYDSVCIHTKQALKIFVNVIKARYNEMRADPKVCNWKGEYFEPAS